ncbi:SGNH/GDSL hydrolase family protein [Rhodococcus pyridinivorans]|uniref:SGNH/GDSL hydrolase family protein n=1 Tax=Rhodococcus pyridinivorans TaxID=103816 RepID=UPI003AABE73D
MYPSAITYPGLTTFPGLPLSLVWPPPGRIPKTVASRPRITVTLAPVDTVQERMPWRPRVDVEGQIPFEVSVDFTGELAFEIERFVPLQASADLYAAGATITIATDVDVPLEVSGDVAVAMAPEFTVPLAAEADVFVVPARIMSFANGGMGQTVASDLSTASQHGIRIPVKLFAPTKRWRIRMRNYDMTGTSKSALTGKGIVFGRHGTNGNFQGSTASTIVSGDFSIPGTGGFYASPWVTEPGLQFEAGVEYLIGTGYTMSFTSMQTTIGKCWRWSSAANAISPSSTGGSIPAGIPLDFVLEYEVSASTHDSAWLVVGDSIFEGVQGPQGTSSSSITPTEIHKSPAQLWAESRGLLVDNLSMAGMSAAVFATSSFTEFWSRQDLASGLLSGALVTLGSNDAFGNRTLEEYQADMATIVAKIRTIIGENAPIYLATIIPRNALTSAQNSMRTSANAWIRTNPLGVDGHVDLDAVMRNSSSPNTLQATLTCDQIHPSYAGASAIAAKLAADIPLLASV